MCYGRLLCLAVVALSLAPAAAQEAPTYQHIHTPSPALGEALFLETSPSSFALPDRLSVDLSGGGAPVTAPAALITGGALPRRLSIGAFFSPERRQQLLGNVGDREREEQEEKEQQRENPSPPSEAVATPGTQVHTYLPELQRPPYGPAPRRASVLRSNAGTANTDFLGGPARRTATGVTPGPRGPTAWQNGELVARSVATQSALLQQFENGIIKALPTRAAGQGDTANAALLGGFLVNKSEGAKIPTSSEERSHTENSPVLLISGDEQESHCKTTSTSHASAGSPLDRENRNGEEQKHVPAQGRTSDPLVNTARDSFRPAVTEQEWLNVENAHAEGQTSATQPSSIEGLLTVPHDEHGATGERAENEAARLLSFDFGGTNRQLVAGIYDAFAAASGTLDGRGVAARRRMEASNLLPTVSVVSPLSAAPSGATSESRGWWPFAGSSSTTTRRGDCDSPAGTHSRNNKLSTGLKEAVANVKSTAVDEAKEAAGTARDAAQAVTKRAGPFSKVLWYLTASKEEKERAATKAALDAAVSSLTTTQSAAAALAIPGAYPGATARAPSETGAFASGRQTGDSSSQASTFFPQWLVPNRRVQTATDNAVPHDSATAGASQEPRGWWTSKSRPHETIEQHQHRLSGGSARGWWGTTDASATDLQDVASTVQSLTTEKAKEIFGTSASEEKKAKEKSGSLSSLWWLFTSTKQEKKNAAAKAAVKAALSWIADTQNHMQATLKTLLPASTLQNMAQAAGLAASHTDAHDLPLLEKPGNKQSADTPGFFHLEDVLQRLTARQQQLSTFTDEQATNWYSTLQQQVKQEGLSSALAGWLYAGSSDSSTQPSGASTHYGQNRQQIGAPSVSAPFFPTGFWSSTADDDAAQRQQQREQHAEALQPSAPSSGPLHWVKNLFTRRGEGDGKPQTFVPEDQRWQLEGVRKPNNSYSWASWIGGGHQKAPETEASNLIRKAATASLIDSHGKSLSESRSTLLPFANAVNWMLPTKRASTESERNSNTLPRISEASMTGGASTNAQHWPGDAGVGDLLAPQNFALSLQSALLGGSKKEEGTHADKEPVRAPGLKQGVYWWEWQAYPSDKTSAKTREPVYMRHVHLDCDPVLPFHACIRDCQKDSARSLLRSSSNKKTEKVERTEENIASTDVQSQEPLALGSYEFSTLRSCYLSCKQKWLDRDLPGCLRADGVKVEGTPPAAAYRSTTTSTTTTTTTTPTPSTTVSDAVDSPKPKYQGFWIRMRPTKPETESDSDASAEKERATSAFSFFRRQTPAEKSSSSAAETERSRSFKNLFGLLQKSETVPPTPNPTLTESLVNLPQSLWNQLKSAEANAADGYGAAASVTGATDNGGADSLLMPDENISTLAETLKGADAINAQHTTESSKGEWTFPWTVDGGGDRQSSAAPPASAGSKESLPDTGSNTNVAADALRSRLYFKSWCILLVLCVGGALISMCLVALRRHGVLSNLWVRFQSDDSSHTGTSWLRWHLYEQMNPLNESCMQKCMQHLNVRSSEEGTSDFERSKSATQPLMCDGGSSV